MDKFKGYLVGRMEILVEFQMCRGARREWFVFLKISLAELAENE